MIQGVHHDNYDLWKSKYQPWNSVNIGPKRDLLREWVNACHKYHMRYGVTFHHEYTWWWWQTAFGCDKQGKKAGVPYDGHLTLADGKGKWWEGYDPRLLYGIDLREYESVATAAQSGWSPPKAGVFSRHLEYANWFAKQWALRMMDVTENYAPDFIYTDGTYEGPFTGRGTGTGYKCNAMQTVVVHSLADDKGYLASKIRSVKLLGYKGNIQWKQISDGLQVTYPEHANLATAAVLCIDIND